MRLSDVLSKPVTAKFQQVEGFLSNKELKCGKQKKIDAGVVSISYFCKKCDDNISFLSGKELFCIGINDRLISIDCAVTCPRCGAIVPVWFLVESQNNIFSSSPSVRILKRTEKLTENISLGTSPYEDYSEWFDKADQAYRDDLGAGALVYLRKIYESITIKSASAVGVDILKKNGSQRPFKLILEEVDKKCHIIPSEFSNNGYKLFGELSDIVHGEYDEEIGLKKYEALRRLVIGVLDNVKNSREIKEARIALGWPETEEIVI